MKFKKENNKKIIEYHYNEYDLSNENDIHNLVNDVNRSIDEWKFQSSLYEQKLMQIQGVIEGIWRRR